jgi:hypothetical protein
MTRWCAVSDRSADLSESPVVVSNVVLRCTFCVS